MDEHINTTLYVSADSSQHEPRIEINQTNSSINESDYLDEIEVDQASSRYKKENVDCVANLINSCRTDDVYLLYATGSMYLKILGPKDGYCVIDIFHEIEGHSNQ